MLKPNESIHHECIIVIYWKKPDFIAEIKQMLIAVKVNWCDRNLKVYSLKVYNTANTLMWQCEAWTVLHENGFK